MKFRAIAMILIIFNLADAKAQSIDDGIKITKGINNSEKKPNYAVLEIVIKDKQSKKEINSFFIQFDKVGVLVNDEKGYSKFFIKPGKYDILVKVVGYNDKWLRNFKLLNSHYRIEIELDVKKEIMN
jgi:TusA-related sulfurtransferase